MTAQTAARHLVVVVTHGIEHELSSVALTIACGGITAGLRVSLFLTSSCVDLVRQKAVDMTQVQPLGPLRKLLTDVIERGGKIWACTPCVRSRGYAQQDLIPGVEIAGASAIH